MSLVKATKELREMTGCGMMDCKKALEETGGNLEEAALWLRKQGMAKAAKKADRDASEGAVGVVTDGAWGGVLFLASETDFVARNERFQALLSDLLTLMARTKPASLEAFAETKTESGQAVADLVQESVGVVGESLKLGGLKTLSVESGLVGSYIHNNYTSNTGKIGALVALSGDASVAGAKDLAENLAMQIVASNPKAVRESDLDPELLAKEKTFLEEEAHSSGKPPAAIEKILEGRIKKFLKEVLLEEQPFLMDETKTASKAAAEQGFKIDSFAVLKVG